MQRFTFRCMISGGNFSLKVIRRYNQRWTSKNSISGLSRDPVNGLGTEVNVKIRCEQYDTTASRQRPRCSVWEAPPHCQIALSIERRILHLPGALGPPPEPTAPQKIASDCLCLRRSRGAALLGLKSHLLLAIPKIKCNARK